MFSEQEHWRGKRIGKREWSKVRKTMDAFTVKFCPRSIFLDATIFRLPYIFIFFLYILLSFFFSRQKICNNSILNLRLFGISKRHQKFLVRLFIFRIIETFEFISIFLHIFGFERKAVTFHGEFLFPGPLAKAFLYSKIFRSSTKIF